MPELNTLFVTHIRPLGAGTGVQQRCRNHITALLEIGKVTVLHADRFGVAAESDRYFIDLPVARLRIPCLTREPGKGRVAAVLAALRWESAYRYTYDDGELAALRRTLQGQRFDLVVLFRLSAYLLARALGLATAFACAKLLIDFDDVESVAEMRRIRRNWRAPGLESTTARLITAARTRMLESEILRCVDGVGICSELDRNRIARGRAIPLVLPNIYVDPGVLPPCVPGGPPRLFFVGALFYSPNNDGALWFLREILPLIRAGYQRPFRVDIAGRGASPGLVTLAAECPDVRLLGFVPDLRRCYESANLVLAPLRSGGGTRIKILEAMAFGRPVVTTTVGAEGLRLTPGADALFADSAADFAAACIRLLADEGLAGRLVASARATYERNYRAPAAEAAFRHAVRQMEAMPPTIP